MLHVLKDYAGVSCFLVLFTGIMSGLTLGLMSLVLVELEILQRSGTPNKKKQATNHLSFISYRVLNQRCFKARKKQSVTTLQAMAKRAKAELKGGTLKTVSDKGNGSNSAKSLTGSEKAKHLKKTELVKKPLPKMTKTPGKSVVEGLAGDKGSWHVKFLLPGFHGSSPKTKQSFPQKQNSKSNQFAGSPLYSLLAGGGTQTRTRVVTYNNEKRNIHRHTHMHKCF
ncbi:hypothetical protein Bca52824_060011 [Brassica carinata]|uniref:Uncharacterized protein n=1 Tax=Brassica carinata TaxID=52824 RepID=A0A8X7UH78_BRACI|nr:hypothetical protein Bca52824_060011 [Brassica carinata]